MANSRTDLSGERDLERRLASREVAGAKPQAPAYSVAERSAQLRSSAYSEHERASCSRSEQETGKDNWLEPEECSNKL